jgi:formyl-CoA transferase
MTHSSPQALANIRVLDLSRVLAGPYCSMLLADYGADVIKVEQPGLGDATRQWGPPWLGSESAYYLSVNRNKRSITVNLKHPAGRDIIHALAAQSDILIENFLPGTMAEWHLDYETLSATNPGLIYCSITGYGQTGPYRDRPGYDFMIQAQGGIMSITGPSGGPPHKVGVAIVDITAGLFAANAILAALHHRTQTGLGQYIDVALLDTQVAWLANVAHNYFATGDPPTRHANAHPNIVPYESFPTADGHLALAIGSDDQYRRLCTLLDRPDLWDDQRYQTNPGRVTHRATLIPQLQDLFCTRSTAEWVEMLVAAGLPAAPINHIPTILADPQVAAREMVRRVEHPTAGQVDLLGPVAKLSRTPPDIHGAPPLLGADTAAILADLLGYTPAQIAHLHNSGAV